jgi:large subunit ribosomal protein L15
MPLSRRLPKLRGESNKSRGRAFAATREYNFELKLSEVAAKVKGNKVDNETLLEAGLLRPISKKISVKILFDKEISKKLQVEGVQVSKTAQEAITKAGGTVA